MHCKRAAILLAVMLLLVVAVPAQAITNGQPDNGRHPYVGIVAFYLTLEDALAGRTAWFCSGSLLAPRVVLTAGHCTDGAEWALVAFDPDVRPPHSYTPYLGKPVTHPDYAESTNLYGGNGLPSSFYRDVGLVVLLRDQELPDTGAYAQLPAPGLVDTFKNKTPVDFVGYGAQEQIKTEPGQPPIERWDGQGVRMYAPSELVSGDFVNSADTIRLALNPGGGSGGACFGDSGGPDLLGGTATVLAVNSYFTNVNCSGVGYSSRVDVPEVLEWMQPCLDSPDACLTGAGSK